VAANSPTNSWQSIASSTDGSHLLAAGLGGTFTSSDSGGTWTQSNFGGTSFGGTSAASSADGSRLIVCNMNGLNPVYTSTDFGLNWTTNISGGGCAVSADGGEFLVAGGGVWVYHPTTSPLLNLAQSDSNLALSWLIPSTNFVVQQSPDLISWSSVTDQPALNLTNLNYEMNFAPSNTSGFFRLVSQ
jgi:hypothetical protein